MLQLSFMAMATQIKLPVVVVAVVALIALIIVQDS